MKQLCKYLLISPLCFIMSKAIGQNAMIVKDIRSGLNPSEIENFKKSNGYFYFTANDGVHGNELWKSDGTEAGTALLYDINNNGTASSSPANFEIMNNILYFSANDGTFGYELWKSDGTASGTQLLKDIKPNGLSSFPFQLTKINNTTFYFVADYEEPNFPYPPIQHGFELWKSDGTTSGTALLQELSGGAAHPYIETLTGFNGEAAFTYFDGGFRSKLGGFINNNLYDPGPSPIYYSISSNYKFGLLNNNLIFGADQNSAIGEALWIKPSGATTCNLLKDIGGNDEADPYGFTEVNGYLYFTASTASTGYELWKTDGTNAGTVLVKNVYPGSSSSGISNLVNFNGTLFFTAYNAENGNELWKSDGTTNGTVLVKDINVGISNSYPSNLTVVGNKLYFVANDGVHGFELWKTDGTTIGTVLVQDINEGSADAFQSSTYNQLIELNSTLYFTANDGIHGRELWRTTQPDCGNLASIATFYYPTTSVSTISAIENQFFFANYFCNQLIAKILPIGNAYPIAGDVSAKVFNYNIGIPLNIVARHYEINPITNPALASGKITLYFDQNEFDDFNQNNNPAWQDYGDGPLPFDDADPLDNRKNLRIIKYNGISNDGTGFPASYSGNPIIINPDDSDIVYNATHNRWEVTFNSAGAGGYFVQSADIVQCNQVNQLYNTQDGNWNVADIWNCGRVPLATDEVTIKSLNTVTIPLNFQGVAKKIILEPDGKLDMKAGASVKLN